MRRKYHQYVGRTASAWDQRASGPPVDVTEKLAPKPPGRKVRWAGRTIIR